MGAYFLLSQDHHA